MVVVNGARHGPNARVEGRDVSGKTGTAQVISLQGGKQAAGKTDTDLRDHGWFAFFAPRDNPEISGVVFAEHSLHGSEAARIARHVIDTYFAAKEGRDRRPTSCRRRAGQRGRGRRRGRRPRAAGRRAGARPR